MKKSFEIDKIKTDMMELWKNTFHDSNYYINLVFDTYFSLENAFTVYDGEKLVASLLGVEYEFQAPNGRGETKKFKGMYLCGLATHMDYRRQGIMGRLMEEAENSAKARGFAITFLIPADSHLREYYRKKGYYTSSYRITHIEKNEKTGTTNKMYIYTFKELFERGKLEFIREVAGWCSDLEKRNKGIVTILHSKTDMMAIISENENSFFITDSTFDPEYPILANVRAVVFPTDPDEEKKILSILGIYFRDESDISSNKSQTRLPKSIKDVISCLYPNFDVEINLPYTGDENTSGEGISPYAMIKPIGDYRKFVKNENSKFKISLMLD